MDRSRDQEAWSRSTKRFPRSTRLRTTTYVEADYDEPVQYAQATMDEEPMVEEPMVEEQAPEVEEYTPVVEAAPVEEPAAMEPMAPVEAPATPVNVRFAEPEAEADDDSGELFRSRDTSVRRAMAGSIVASPSRCDSRMRTFATCCARSRSSAD